MAQWYNPNAYLTNSQRENNATIMYNLFTSWGWNVNTIFALLGNMEHESSLSPGIVENLATNNPPTKGYGLIQWTNTKATVVTQNTLWAWIYAQYGNYDWQDGTKQCIFINSDDRSAWIPVKSYPITYDQFKAGLNHNNQPATLEYLTKAYFYNRERGTWSNNRLTYAQKWYDFFRRRCCATCPSNPSSRS